MKVRRAERTFSPDDLLSLDLPYVRRLLAAFVGREVRRAGFGRVVIGLSGGVDSSLSAAIAAEALGRENVHAVRLPYRQSSPESLEHASRVADLLGLRPETIDISAAADGYVESQPGPDRLRRGNFLARVRMAVLFDLSARERALVLGTSNKSEILLGYTTWYGDGAHAINPLGDLYKTQVRALGREMGLPAWLVEKAPSADLWPGQTSEGELGFTYADADRLLVVLVDHRTRPEECVAQGFDPRLVDAVVRRVRASQYKRRLPVVAKISQRSVPIDFRYLRDWGT